MEYHFKRQEISGDRVPFALMERPAYEQVEAAGT